MAFPAGDLNCRYEVQEYTPGSASATGSPVRTWVTAKTVWGSRLINTPMPETERAGAMVEQLSEVVQMRHHRGIRADQRLLRKRDKTTVATSINASATALVLSDVLMLDGGNIDYVKIGDEIMRVKIGRAHV